MRESVNDRLQPERWESLLQIPTRCEHVKRRRSIYVAARILVSVASILAVLGLSAQIAPAVGFEEMVANRAGGSGFVQAFLLIFLSELGDKTFFIAGLLAAKFSRMISFVGSIGALSVMTILSTAVGNIFRRIPQGISQGLPISDYVAVASFTYFGARTLYDAFKLPAGDSSGIEEEKKEAEEAVAGVKKGFALAAIAQTFGLVFAAEIGDRSCISTIALAASLNPVAVALGAIIGHALATGVAVTSFSFISKYLSEKVIGYIGGSLFLLFAITTALGVF